MYYTYDKWQIKVLITLERVLNSQLKTSQSQTEITGNRFHNPGDSLGFRGI